MGKMTMTQKMIIISRRGTRNLGYCRRFSRISSSSRSEILTINGTISPRSSVVLRSYGWMLPFVLLSLLAISGPKAFFPSIAAGIGVSALAFAADKLLQGPPRSRPRRKYRRINRKSSGHAGYWEGGNRDGSVEQDGGSNAPSFGGWDELDKGMGTIGSMKRPARRGDGLGRKKAELRRLSWEEKSDMSLLLRLIIAAFPFFGFMD